jgi:hypothetical protein
MNLHFGIFYSYCFNGAVVLKLFNMWADVTVGDVINVYLVYIVC